MEERIFFDSIGVRIEGLFENAPGERGVVVSHPHPLYGGSMHNHVVKAIVRAYREMGYSTLRFNFRGVEKSGGDFDNGIGEQEDVEAALKYMSNNGKTHIDLAGYSFGAWVNALGLERYDRAERLLMVSPPVSFIDFSFLKYHPKIQLIIAGSRDDIGGHETIEKLLPRWNPEAIYRLIDGADHFYGDQADEIKTIIQEFLASD